MSGQSLPAALAWLTLYAIGITTVALIIFEAVSRWLAPNVDRMAKNAAAELATMDDDWADPWHATPTFRDMCAENPAAVDAIAAAEAARADWEEPSRWTA